jgi:hypothetical protein
MTTTNVTENEKALLNAIVKSEYQCSSHPIDCSVWMFSPSDALGGKRKVSGIVSSCVKKGLVETGSYEKPSDVISITAAGWEVYKTIDAKDAAEWDAIKAKYDAR